MALTDQHPPAEAGAETALANLARSAVALPRWRAPGVLLSSVTSSAARRASRVGRPLFWLALIAFILAPCACFLVLAVSPRLFDQGPQWFTLSYLRQSFAGGTLVALVNSLWVSVAAAGFGVVVGFPLAWLASRTTMPGRRLVRGAMWLVLLLPSWLPALGWVRLVEPDGVMYRLGLNLPAVTHAMLGPFGVVLLLGLRSVPFAFLAISAAFGGLGQEFEHAARVHGAGRAAAIAVVARMLAPAISSALAIGFAESVSDFGVAATLAYTAHFPLITFQLYAAIGNFPANFPGAAAMGWLLVGSVAVPLALQARALKGRSYAVLSGRTRPLSAVVLTPKAVVAAVAGVAAFYLLALDVPGLGAISGSLLGDYGSSFQLTWANYHAVFSNSELLGPVERSLVYGFIAATVTVVGGFVAARLLATHAEQGDEASRLPASGSGRLAERGVRGWLHLRLQPPDNVQARYQPLPDDDLARDRLCGEQPSH